MAQLVSELVLEELPIETSAFATDPMPHMEAATRRHPWLAKSTATASYVVLDYNGMKEMLLMDTRLKPASEEIIELMGGKGTAWGRFQAENMLMRAGADHARLRGNVGHAFTVKAANKLRPKMQEVVSRLLDEWAPKGAFDFAEFASYFPITIMFGVIGASPGTVASVRDSLETMGAGFSLDPTLMPDLEKAFGVLWDFADGLIREREASGVRKDDLLNDLIEVKAAGGMTDIEIRDMLIMLFVGGYDTSKNLLTMIMYLMLQRPDDWERAAHDREFSDRIVEETLRFGSIASPSRTVVEEFVYRDVRFPVGTMLIFPTPLSGRDPTAFQDAMEFQPERRAGPPHLAFGRGIHFCLGLNIARAQIQEGVHLIAQRITHPKLAGELEWRTFFNFWALHALPITFTPASAHPKADVRDPTIA